MWLVKKASSSPWQSILLTNELEKNQANKQQKKSHPCNSPFGRLRKNGSETLFFP
jgi:hypothetical protein